MVEFEAVCNFSVVVHLYCSSFVCNVKVDNKSRDRSNPLRKVMSVDSSSVVLQSRVPKRHSAWAKNGEIVQ